MSDRLGWLHGLLLPVKGRAAFVAARLGHRGTPPPVAAALAAAGDRAQRDRWAARVRAHARTLGARVITPDDPCYPRECLRLADPPAALFVRGDVSLLAGAAAVGVVGTRRGTERGRLTAERIGAGLARAGVAVVSGLAYGVDGASHRGCLHAGGRPIGVLGTGIDVVYPSGHLDLQEEVARAGCLVTEYPPGTPARRFQFVARNRIIAALGKPLVVVEAGSDSGALSTVDFAQQLGREVLVVPGPVDCPHAAGCLQLLREGATLVRGAADVLECLQLDPALAAGAAPLGLDTVPRTAGEIAQRMRWTVPQTLAALTELELLGMARRTAAGRYVAPTPGPRT